jgi:hypothetical protein
MTAEQWQAKALDMIRRIEEHIGQPDHTEWNDRAFVERLKQELLDCARPRR